MCGLETRLNTSGKTGKRLFGEKGNKGLACCHEDKEKHGWMDGWFCWQIFLFRESELCCSELLPHFICLAASQKPFNS